MEWYKIGRLNCRNANDETVVIQDPVRRLSYVLAFNANAGRWELYASSWIQEKFGAMLDWDCNRNDLLERIKNGTNFVAIAFDQVAEQFLYDLGYQTYRDLGKVVLPLIQRQDAPTLRKLVLEKYPKCHSTFI